MMQHSGEHHRPCQDCPQAVDGSALGAVLPSASPFTPVHGVQQQKHLCDQPAALTAAHTHGGQHSIPLLAAWPGQPSSRTRAEGGDFDIKPLLLSCLDNGSETRLH